MYKLVNAQFQFTEAKTDAERDAAIKAGYKLVEEPKKKAESWKHSEKTETAE